MEQEIKLLPLNTAWARGNVIFLIPFYLQAVQIHSANGVKLLEA
jgi:hypothetical protein